MAKKHQNLVKTRYWLSTSYTQPRQHILKSRQISFLVKKPFDQTQRIYCSMSTVENAGFSRCKYSSARKHFNIFCWCTIVYFTMQACSLTFTHTDKGMYGSARKTKLSGFLCITGKVASDKNRSLCCWAGNPAERWQARTKLISSLTNRMDKWTDKKHGQSGWILGKGRDRWIM